MSFSFLWNFPPFCVSVKLGIGKLKKNSSRSTFATKISIIQKNLKKNLRALVCVRNKSLQCTLYRKMVLRRLRKLLLRNRARQYEQVKRLFLFPRNPQMETPVQKTKVEVHHAQQTIIENPMAQKYRLIQRREQKNS